MDISVTFLSGLLLDVLPGLVDILSMRDDSRSEPFHAVDLGRILQCIRNNDYRRNIEFACGNRHPLTVTPHTGRNEAVLTELLIKIGDKVVKSPDFERSCWKCILTLEVNISIEFS